mgnify:CR=1 FL=1
MEKTPKSYIQQRPKHYPKRPKTRTPERTQKKREKVKDPQLQVTVKDQPTTSQPLDCSGKRLFLTANV